jgi:hypothetical protein
MEQVLDAMELVQRRFIDGLMALPFRANGFTDKTKDATFEWYALTPLAPKPARDPNTPPALVGRTMAHLLNLSAHQTMAMSAFAGVVQSDLLECVGLIRAHIPVLGANPGPLQLVATVGAQGVLSTPLWRVAHHGFHGLSPTGSSRAALEALLADLAAEPAPTGVYKIGNKTYAAAGPESALAQHIRLLAPKTPKHKRKPPTTIPSVLRVWDRQEAQTMAKAITVSWSNKG